MSYSIKDNTFSLFENDKKGNDKAPDFRGKGMVDGKEVRVAVWKRKSASGIEYLSGTIEEPFKPAEPTPTKEEPKEEPIAEAVADEIPF